MKIITTIRDFSFRFQRYYVSSLFNIVGLTIAYIVFIIIMMQVIFDNGYDKFHKDYDRIYRLEFIGKDTLQMQAFSWPFYKYISKNKDKHIQDIMAVFGSVSNGVYDVNNQSATIGLHEVETGFVNLFDFRFIEGNITAFDNGLAIIPESMAMEYWGRTNVIGDSIISIYEKNYIGGVYKDLSENSIIRNVIYTKLRPKSEYDYWSIWNYNIYVKIDNPKNIDTVLTSLNSLVDDINEHIKANGGSINKFVLNPIYEIHFTADYYEDDLSKTSHKMVYLMSIVSLMIILIAGFNFANYSIAIIPMRTKNVNIKRILGANVWKLRLTLLSEPLIISIASWCISIIGVFMCQGTFVETLITPKISLIDNLDILLMSFIVAIIIGILAGLYSTWHLTTMPTGFALKHHFGISSIGRKVRNALLCIQFISSFTLIACSVFMYLQGEYMLSADLGYNKDNLIVSDIKSKENKNELYHSIKQIEGVTDVSLSDNILSSKDFYQQWGTHNLQFTCVYVTPEYLNTLGIEIIEGRGFLPTDLGAYIFNETAQKSDTMVRVGKTLGRGYIKGEIVGICKNIQFVSMRSEITPMAFKLNEKYSYNTISIRFDEKCDTASLKLQIKKTLKTVEPNYPHNVRLLNEELVQTTYKNESRTTKQISIFSLVAIIISIMGIIGMLILESEYRRKEIAIRKTQGATTHEILLQFNWYYLRLLILSFALSLPISIYFISLWLNNFAFHIPIYWWVFAFIFCVITVITVTCITLQFRQNAKSLPIKILNCE